VIVGFSAKDSKKKRKLFSGTEPQLVDNINGYLLNAENIFVESRAKALCDVPEIGIGNMPIDDGNYLFEKAEMTDFIKKEPAAEKYFHTWYGSKEFINRSPRYCLWLGECPPDELRKMPLCRERVKNVQDFRNQSTRPTTKKLAERPLEFGTTNMPNGAYIVIPKVSSEKRRYVPMGYMTPDILCSDLVFIIPNATLFHLGVLTSNVHMAWMRAVCGRLEMRYRYSKDIVYNNFPWPNPTEEQKETIARTAQAILDARERYPSASLADLYDEVTMPADLRKAHHDNDRAVMQAYGFNVREMSEADCVAALMKMYEKLTVSE
jgi:hypothetical protein